MVLSAMVKRADVIIVTAILLFSVIFGFLAGKTRAKGGEKYACVYIDGKKEYSYPLSGKKTAEDVKIKSKYGYNEIVVESGCVYVSDSDCKSKDCINSGRISGNNEFIICAPHKLMIKIEKTLGDDDVSAVTY